MHFLFSRIVVLGASLTILSGCVGTAPSRFYVLSSLTGPKIETQAGADERRLAIGIGPIEFPEYLDRPQIVTRVSANELKLSEFHQWAEPLKDNFSRALAENLSILLSTDRIAVFPWRGSTPIDYQVAVEVTRFDGEPARDVSLIARWTVYEAKGKRVLLTRKSNLSVPTGASGYEALVFSQSRVLANLSREIADALKDISHRDLPSFLKSN